MHELCSRPLLDGSQDEEMGDIPSLLSLSLDQLSQFVLELFDLELHVVPSGIANLFSKLAIDLATLDRDFARRCLYSLDSISRSWGL